MSDTLDRVIKSANVDENLYVTNLRISFPSKDLAIDPRDLIDQEIVETWSTEGARCRFSLKISDDINQFIDHFTVRRRQILQYLMFDGHNFLMFENKLNDYLESCQQLDNDFVERLEEILAKWDTIRSDYEFKLTEKMTTAVKRSSTSINHVELETQVKQAVENYMTRKFPSAEYVRDRCGVFFDTPRLFKQASPTGLSKEALAAYEKSQEANLRIIYQLIINDYKSTEIEVCVGFIDDLIAVYRDPSDPHIKYGIQKIDKIFNESLLNIVESGTLPSDDDSDTDDEFDLLSNKKQKDKESLIDDDIISCLNKKYNVSSFRKFLKQIDNVYGNIISSRSLLEKIVDDSSLIELEIIERNLLSFKKWCDAWLDEWENSKKSTGKRKLVKIADNVIDHDGIKTVTEQDVETVIVSEIDDYNTDIVLPLSNEFSENVTKEFSISVDTATMVSIDIDNEEFMIL